MADPPAPAEAQPEQAPAAAAAPSPAPANAAEDAAPAEKPPPAAPLTPEPDAAASAAAADGAADEDEEEYVSDPDDAPLPTTRRREASDDEGSEDAGRPRARIGPDQDDDGQGAPEAYDDEEDDEEEYSDEEGEDDLGEGFEEEGYQGRAAPPMEPMEDGGGEVSRGEDGVTREEGLPPEEEEGKAEGEEKEQEPFAVPTSGAFYMHDDRFQEENRGRRRRMFGVRKLWDAKDDQAWVHDRFEEMNLHDDRYEDQRMSRGRFRGRGGRGKARGGGRGFSRGAKQRNYQEDGNNQNRPQKVVRGRGPRRYEAVARDSREAVGSQRKQAARFREPAPNAAAARDSGQVSFAQPEAAPPKKNVINSSLNSASPPFYPSGASTQDFPVAAQRRDVHTGGSNKIPPSSMKMDDKSASMVRGRTSMDYGGRDRFHADGPVRSSPGRVPATSPNSGFTSSSVNPGQSPVVRGSGGNSNIGISSNNQPTSSPHQTSRITQPQSHVSVMHQKSGQVQNQSAARIPTQQLIQRTSNSPAAQHLPVKSTESGENGSYPSLNNSKTASAVVKANNQETGMGSFMYGGTQVIGAAGLSQGDQNFPGTPALLPVMQFGGQHPGGPGVPTIGMALPGYVAQQQMGMGNNEMAWLPLLAGATGAFGGSYPPYIALDPSFYSRSSGQTSSSVPSRETSANRGSKSPPQNDIGNEELDQRQNKPRRYSEMNFSQ